MGFQNACFVQCCEWNVYWLVLLLVLVSFVREMAWMQIQACRRAGRNMTKDKSMPVIGECVSQCWNVRLSKGPRNLIYCTIPNLGTECTIGRTGTFLRRHEVKREACFRNLEAHTTTTHTMFDISHLAGAMSRSFHSCTRTGCMSTNPTSDPQHVTQCAAMQLPGQCFWKKVQVARADDASCA